MVVCVCGLCLCVSSLCVSVYVFLCFHQLVHMQAYSHACTSCAHANTRDDHIQRDNLSMRSWKHVAEQDPPKRVYCLFTGKIFCDFCAKSSYSSLAIHSSALHTFACVFDFSPLMNMFSYPQVQSSSTTI